ncbi:hypothetical protein [uncultured Mycolicibacterium sp.]|uniref:hypothetical protein n=1 Tax=uncultured Mycolicibacterium sp. TaxID=2320817 RepID=UPI0032B1E3BC
MAASTGTAGDCSDATSVRTIPGSNVPVGRDRVFSGEQHGPRCRLDGKLSGKPVTRGGDRSLTQQHNSRLRQ